MSAKLNAVAVKAVQDSRGTSGVRAFILFLFQITAKAGGGD